MLGAINFVEVVLLNILSVRIYIFGSMFMRYPASEDHKRRGAFWAPLLVYSSRYQLPLNPDTKLQGVEGYRISSLVATVSAKGISGFADLVHAVVPPFHPNRGVMPEKIP